MFTIQVCRMCCKLTENFEQQKNNSIASESPETSHVFWSMHLHYTAILVCFFQRSFAQNLKNISLIIWYCCNIWRPYKISNILYKTKKKAVSFLSTTSGMSRDLSWMTSFSWPHGMSLFRNIERCVVLSFSGPTLVQHAVEHCTVRFFRSLLRIFWSFPPVWVCKIRYCEKWHLPVPKIWNPFFYLAEYSMKNFITRQYLVNLMCNCWLRMCTQFHQKLVIVLAFCRLFSGVARIFC